MFPRLLAVGACLSSVLFVSCGGSTPAASPTPPPPGTRQSPEMEALFGSLPPPVVARRQDSVPRLVLRDGPAVPPTNHVESPLAITPATVAPPSTQPAAPLKVLSYGPKGDDTLTGAVFVTFDQPMVKLAQLRDLAPAASPLVIAPAVDGTLRWLGTSTLAFEPSGGRLPLATDYQVTIPTGTQSALGGVLQSDLRFTIKTPAPQLVEHVPHDGATGIGLTPWIALRFNQRMDHERVAAALKLDGPGRPTLRVVSAEQFTAKHTEHPEVAYTPDERTVIVTPTKALSPGAQYRVVVPAGLVGAEGPKPSSQAQGFDLRTYEPLRVVKVHCGWDRCVPGVPVSIEFNQPLASTDADVQRLVQVRPAPGGLEPRVEDSRITLHGDYAPRVRYQIQVAAGIVDVHGQTLARTFTGAITIGDAPPQVSLDLPQLSTLERHGPHTLDVPTVNVSQLQTRIAPVSAAQALAALRAIENFRPWQANDSDPFRAAALRPVERTLSERGVANRSTTLTIPLDGAVSNGQAGMVMVQLKSQQPDFEWNGISLVQVTNLNAVVLSDVGGTVVRVLSLSDAAPIEGASVELLETSDGRSIARGKTDASGVARLGESREGQRLLRVVHQDDHVLVPLWIGGRHPEVVGSILTDRDPYRPGDTVHFKLLSRMRDASARGDIRTPDAGTPVGCQIRDAHYQEIGRADGELSPYGTFSHSITIPSQAALGHWHVQCNVAINGAAIGGTFQVQEYRAPEIEVTVKAPDGTHHQGGTASFVVQSDYLFGAPGAGLAVEYSLAATPEAFAPPNHDDFHFGPLPVFPMPWMRSDQMGTTSRVASRATTMGVASMAAGRMFHPGFIPPAAPTLRGQATLDAAGKATITVPLEPGAEHGPMRMSLEAAVNDLSRQQVAARDSVLAHPAAIYVGVRAAQRFVASDEPVRITTVAVAVDGSRANGRLVTTRLLRSIGTPVWRPFAPGRSLDYHVEEKEVGRCAQQSSAEPQPCEFPAQPAGRYVIESSATDDSGRSAQTRMELWVHGPGVRPWLSDADSVSITPDKSSYAVGDTARLLVRAPIESGRGLLSLERRGAVEVRPIQLDGGIAVIDVPITEAHVPNLTVRLSLSRGRLSDAALNELLAGLGPEAKRALASDVGRPVHVSGTAELTVDRDRKRLSVTVTTDHATRAPSEEVGVTVNVREPNGALADAEIMFMAVDEAVLSLLDYRTPDPLPVLLPPVYSSTTLGAAADHVIRRAAIAHDGALPSEPTSVLAQSASAPPGVRKAGRSADMMAVAESARAPEATGPATLRSLFATTAYYLGSARTQHGKVQTRFVLPDNLTRFRLMAIAIGRGDHSGSGDGAVTVRKPLLLRPALPRVASFGDRFGAAVIVHNETGADREVSVGIRVAGLSVNGAPFTRELLRAGEAREVSFPVTVDHATGVARVQFAAATDGGSDAVEVSVPLIEPATSEAFATYGSLTEGAVRFPLQPPADAIDRFGGLEVALSSTALTQLSDGAEYLLRYPYGCAEQLGSRLMGASALSQALTGRDDVQAAALRLAAIETIDLLRPLRRDDGSFRLWGSHAETRLAATAWVALALQEAQQAGVALPPRWLPAAAEHLQRHIASAPLPRDRAQDLSEVTLAAYAVWRLGAAVDGATLERLWQARTQLPLFARAWLAATLKQTHARRSEELLRQVLNAAVETAAGAHFAEAETDGSRMLWHSTHRTDAIVLRTLLDLAPTDPRVEKTARALIAARRNGRWQTTQENAWAMSSLTRYMRIAEADEPRLTARAWIGTALLSEHTMNGRATPTMAGTLAMSQLKPIGPSDLTLAVQGRGRLYYRLGLRYAPDTLQHDPIEQGFAVVRTFEPVQEQGTVRRDDDGAWHISAGATVRVRLTVIVPDTRYDVALDDPLAAGLEPVNLAFATSAQQGLSDNDHIPHPLWGRGCWMPWTFSHRELRDDRVTAFSDVIGAGIYELTYLARATTPGRFIVAPSKVEEMYAPETFARSASDVVIVER